MKFYNLRTIASGMLLAAALGLGSTAQATDVPIAGTGFAGIAGNGNSGTDAFGQTWSWGTTSTGLSSWGVPGLGAGEVDDYNGSVPATDFFVAFLTSHTGTYINTTPSAGPDGYNEETRFSVCAPTCVAWTPVYSPGPGPLEVDFLAPAGSSLVNGDDYFVNVIFTDGKLSGKNAGFSAVYSGAVPEVGTWAMMLLGAAGVGGAMRMARRKQDASVATA